MPAFFWCVGLLVPPYVRRTTRARLSQLAPAERPCFGHQFPISRSSRVSFAFLKLLEFKLSGSMAIGEHTVNSKLDVDRSIGLVPALRDPRLLTCPDVNLCLPGRIMSPYTLTSLVSRCSATRSRPSSCTLGSSRTARECSPFRLATEMPLPRATRSSRCCSASLWASCDISCSSIAPLARVCLPDRLLVRALTIQLCHPQTVLLEREQLAVVRIILDELSLSPITTSPLFSIDDGALAGGIAVLAMIVRCVGRRLSDANTCTDGAHLLRQLVYAEAKGARGETVSWDLGKWIDTSAPEYVEKSMSIATAMQEVHDAMADELYPQCAASSELRALWERIGYTGRPDDVFSDPFLSVGAFLMMAEAHEPGPSV